MIRFKLKELLERPGYPPQAELARRMQMSRQQVNRLVNGDIGRFDLKTLDRLCRALRCRSIEELIEYRPQGPTLPSYKDWFIAQLVALTLSPVHQAPSEIYTEPDVRRAAQQFFERHIARSLESGTPIAGLHARMMGRMLNFIRQHGAQDEPQFGDLERLLEPIKQVLDQPEQAQTPDVPPPTPSRKGPGRGAPG